MIKKALRELAARIFRLARNPAEAGWWMRQPDVTQGSPAGALVKGEWYDGDHDFETIGKTQVKNPILEFHERLASGEAKVVEAWLFEAAFDSRGRMAKGDRLVEATGGIKQYRLNHVESTEQYLKRVKLSESAFAGLPEKKRKAREKREAQESIYQKWKERNLVEDAGFGWDNFPLPTGQTYDPGQYTEFVPAMAGPFNKQLYLTDYLQMHAYAFEAWNHNPLAKRGVDIMVQYALGRRIKASFKNPGLEKKWLAFEKQHRIYRKLRRFWARELIIYGELMIDKTTWHSVDPSTVWDIVTDPLDITDVYYYYQNFPTQYNQFAGLKAPGVPGAEKVPATDYIVRQLPFDRIMHTKINCVSNEKRGRSKLFAILGWLKRYKDLYNAIVIKEWINATFVWDYKIKGSAADVSTFASTFSTLQPPGSSRFHNEAVEIQPMPAMPSHSGRGSESGQELLALIATAFGIPKEHFNLVTSSGGNRATALVGSEPFTKCIEELQTEFEEVLLQIAEYWAESNNIPYEEGDIEFIFPSVTKDTTTDMISNIQKAYAAGTITKQMMGEMIAAELNITAYDFDDVQKELKKEKADGIDQLMGPMVPAGRFGQPPGPPSPGDGSPLHGPGKLDTQDSLNAL